jgi:hypothetical protein
MRRRHGGGSSIRSRRRPGRPDARRPDARRRTLLNHFPLHVPSFADFPDPACKSYRCLRASKNLLRSNLAKPTSLRSVSRWPAPCEAWARPGREGRAIQNSQKSSRIDTVRGPLSGRPGALCRDRGARNWTRGWGASCAPVPRSDIQLPSATPYQQIPR